MRRSCMNILLLCGLLIAVVSGPRVFGQAVTATLVGQVSDAAGAAVGTAEVTITQQQTGVTTARMTNESGNYEFTFLPPGIYTVSVKHEGFDVTVIKEVHVAVNTTVRVDAKLNVGSLSQSVTVNDRAPMLQTDRADVSGQIESKQIVDLPVGSSRNFQSLETLIPGVSPAIYDHSSFFDAQNSQSFQVNGQQEAANNLQFEGIDDNERTGELQVYIPPAAAIETVDVETSNYAPEFGRAAGAVTNVTMKSGTNHFHGSAYEFNSVAATSARSYFNNTGKFPGFTNNYYGGTIGGPIHKDRTFFFADFLRYTNHSGVYNLFTVPTAAFRTGDLSAGPTDIYDPNTGSNGVGRQQFVTNGRKNVIPAGRISPVSQNIIALIPLPNIPGAGFTNNYQATLGFRVDSNQYDVKLDQNIGKSDHFAYRYSFQHVTTVQDPAFGQAGGPGGSSGFQGTGVNNTFNTAGNYTHVFSTSFYTEARLGVDHYFNTTRQTDYGSNAAAQIGIPGVNLDPFTSGLTSISVSGYSSPLVGYSPGIPWLRGETNIDAVNNWTKIAGNHTIKFGGEVRRVRDDLTQGGVYGPRGQFTYANGQTALNTPTFVSGFANAWASFLLDVPSQVGRDVNIGDASFRQTLYFGFAQDTWQALPNLTLTYGLRWEFYPPATPKRKGGFSQYDPSTNSLLVSGYGNVPMNLGLKVNDKNFEPRVGFAFRPTSATVLRGGYGISHTPLQGSYYANNYPVVQNIAYNSLSSYTPALNDSQQPATLAQGFPAAPQPLIPSTGIISNAPKTSLWYVVNPTYKDPYVMSYNLTLEQSLGGQWVADIAYVGNSGRQIPGSYNLNAGMVAGAGANGQPEFATFGRTANTQLILKGTNSNYNSLQARVTHHFADGLVWTSAYAYQKAMGYISNAGSPSSFNFYIDFHRNYSVLNYNATHTYSQSFVYELPFGHNKRYLAHGLVSSIVGGWQLSDVLSARTGTPLLFTASTSQLNAPSNIQVPNETSPFRKLHGIGTQHPWFDTTSFSQPIGPVFGNLGQNVYSGPGQLTMNTSAFRTFSLHESLSLQLRMDAFNSLNHPTFANPSASLTSTSFGRVTTTTGAARTLQFAGTLSF
jgi:hypothetical protein